MSNRYKHDDTAATHAGRKPRDHAGIVNPPVYHASTILFPSMEAFDGRVALRHEPGEVVYGMCGTPTTFALEQAMIELEGCHGCVVLPSGMAAAAIAILACVKAGEHLLMVDSAYEPTRMFCDNVLSGLGIETTYYDPLIREDVAKLIRPNTRLVYLESPGSLTFEVQDVPAIANAAHRQGLKVVLDNTWATPVFFKAFEHGVDICVHAGTKYIAGHSDIMSGLITTTEACYPAVRRMTFDDTYMVLRGIRTLPTRLRRQADQGLVVAEWLKQRPEVAQVLHPALPGCPGHDIWRRDFLGTASLFGVVLKDYPRAQVAAMLDNLKLFGLGASWGGFESLLMPAYPQNLRTASPWPAQGQLLRIHVGLENTDDLIADLEAGFERLNQG